MNSILSYVLERKSVLERVKNLLIEQLNLNLEKDEIDNDAPLFGMGLGLDSIDALDLIVGVEREFGIKVNENDMFAFRSVNSLVDYIMGISFEANVSSGKVDFVNEELVEVYDELRENGAVGFREERFFILEMEMKEGILEFLGKFIAGKVHLLDSYKILHSVILDEDGKIRDIVYIMPFENKIWVLVTEASKLFLLEKGKDIGVRDVSEDYEIVGVEGVFSWRYVKEIVGVEILGLTYLRMYEWFMDGERVIVSRAGVTGEYGYRFFIKKGKGRSLMDKFVSLGVKEVGGEVLEKLFLVCMNEFRFPCVPLSIRKGDSVIENELRWMIDWRREDFVGRESLEKEKQNFMEGVICVVIKPSEVDIFRNKEEILREGKIYVGEAEIGRMLNLFFSMKIKMFFGYAKMSKEWAYAGIKGMVLKTKDKDYEIMTVTTPLFLTRSSQVTME
ncbi:hypothetical protein BREVNS_1522 [Brevinematales bacterium NS]|nr:hypothetical protein BREVNS_1522 [Brevinematales bacterium NS]